MYKSDECIKDFDYSATFDCHCVGKVFSELYSKSFGMCAEWKGVLLYFLL